jgi:hypothetical protein
LCSRDIDSWVETHSGKTLKIYDLPGIVNHAILNNFILSSLTSVFANAGIFPLNLVKFQLHDFVATFVTDGPMEEKSVQVFPWYRLPAVYRTYLVLKKQVTALI